MLADPQSITIGGTTTPIPRITDDARTAVYSNPDGTVSVKVSHSAAKGTRRITISVMQSKIAADPITALNARKSALATVSFTVPQDGFSITEIKDAYVGLHGLLSASTYAALVKILGGEK